MEELFRESDEMFIGELIRESGGMFALDVVDPYKQELQSWRDYVYQQVVRALLPKSTDKPTRDEILLLL